MQQHFGALLRRELGACEEAIRQACPRLQKSAASQSPKSGVQHVRGIPTDRRQPSLLLHSKTTCELAIENNPVQQPLNALAAQHQAVTSADYIYSIMGTILAYFMLLRIQAQIYMFV